MTVGLTCACITCGDSATPMRVVALDSARELALCETPEGERRTVEVGLVDGVTQGDQLLVHADTAIAKGPSR